jgi:hypothetical protein
MARQSISQHPYSAVRSKTTLRSGLPPTVGKIGSLAFFVVLFALAEPDQHGYDVFRKCHGNCVNGVLHFVGMPLAVSGVFLLIRAASDSPLFTRILQGLVLTRYLVLYLTFERNPYSPWLFYVLYLCILDGYLYHHVYQSDPAWTRFRYLIVGVLLIIINVGALEVIGHGQYEQHHSYVYEFCNSVFHTPLYGINSVWTTLIASRTDHVCW